MEKELNYQKELERLRRRVEELESNRSSDLLSRRAVKESQDKYRSLIDDVGTPITYLDPDGIILLINSVGAAGFGGRTEDIIGKSIYDLLPDVANLSKKRVKKVIETGSGFSYEDKIGLPSGSHWFNSSFQPVRNSKGDIYAVQVISYDITEKKQTEEQLQLLSSIVKQSTEGIALVNLEGNLQYINNAFAQTHGYTPEELIGKNLSIFHTAEQMKDVEEANRQVQRTGEFTGEIWHRRKDGTIFPAFMHNSIMRDISGKPVGMIGTMRDITQRKHAEDALKESEERFRLLINNANCVLTLFDKDGKLVLVNKIGAANLGGNPEDFIGKQMSEIMPGDAEIYLERNRQVMESEVGMEIEDMLELPTGKRWFSSNIQPARDARGKVQGVQIISHDITERKLSEIMLKKTSEQLKNDHKALQEKNIALKQILEHIEHQRRDSVQQIRSELERAITPLLKRLRKKTGPNNLKEIDALEAALDATLAKDQDDFKRRFARLTSRESEICEMIKGGMSSKQISESLHLSLLTVLKHREQIRKKLGLTNKNINLATYLRTH